jgi:Sugar kinases, ribokinase family
MSQLVAIGEPLIRLSPPAGRPIATADRLDSHVGGAACNVAVAAAGLGVDAAVAASVGAGPLADRIAATLRVHDVRPHLHRDPDGRVGCYWVEAVGSRRVHYDRADTPMATATPDELLAGVDLDAAELVYVSGIVPALGEAAREAAPAIVEAARAAGCTTVVDANYRGRLWPPEAAADAYAAMFAHADIIAIAARDAAAVLGHTGDAVSVAETLCAEYAAAHVICTRGAAGAVAASADGSTATQAALDGPLRDPIGAGDAFVGAVCAALLADHAIDRALADGAAAAAVARATHGDLTPLSPAALTGLVDAQIDR